MAFFDEIGKKIVQVGNDVYGKTKDVTDIVKINSLISEHQKTLDQYFRLLGKKYFDSVDVQNITDSDELVLFEKISNTIGLIDSYNEKIKTLKGIEKCPICNGDIVPDSQFCSHCGNKIVKNENPKCSKCGNILSEDALFCTNCGTKIESNNIDDDSKSKDNPIKEKAIMEHFEEVLQNRTPSDNEHQCQNCGNIQSKQIQRCLNCSELIEDNTDNGTIIKVCPNCQATLEDNQCFCANCGAKIGSELNPEVLEEQFNKCPNCNADIEKSNVFCTNCGFKLKTEED